MPISDENKNATVVGRGVFVICGIGGLSNRGCAGLSLLVTGLGRWITQHIAATPDSLDIVVAACRRRQFLAELADKDIDNLEFRLIHAAIKMVEEHFLGEGGTLAER